MSYKVYDYQCNECYWGVELMVKAGEEDERRPCPACEAGWLVRKPANTRTTFKFADKSGIKRG